MMPYGQPLRYPFLVDTRTTQICLRRPPLYSLSVPRNMYPSQILQCQSLSFSSHICPTDPRLPIHFVTPPRWGVAVDDFSASSRRFAIHDIVARARRNVLIADPLSWYRARPPLSNVRGRGSWRWSAVKVAHRARGLLGEGDTDQHVARSFGGEFVCCRCPYIVVILVIATRRSALFLWLGHDAHLVVAVM